MSKHATGLVDSLLMKEIGQVLGIDLPPESASAKEIAEWVAYWRDAAEHAKSLSPDEIAYLKAGGWWPPSTAENIRTVPPPIVTRTLRRP